MATDRCPECGSPTGQNTGGACIVIDSEHLPWVRMLLLSQEFDQVRCTVCGHKLGVAPTIMVLCGREGVVIVAPGDDGTLSRSEILAKAREYVAQVNAEMGSNTITEILEAESLEQLRRQVWTRLSNHAETIRDMVKARDSKTFTDYIRQHWRALTPDVFVAAYLLNIVRAIRQDLPPDSPELQRRRRILAERQASVWLALCMEWGEWPPERGSFESDLETYLVQTAIVPLWVQAFTKQADQFAADYPDSTAILYCIEAVRATLHAHLGESNPREGEWARKYVGLELQLRGPQQSASELHRLRVAPERARSTTSYRSIFDAITPLFSHPERFEDVGAILSDLGMQQIIPDLAQAVRADTTGAGKLPSAAEMLAHALRANAPLHAQHGTDAVIGGIMAVEAVLAPTLTADICEEMANEALKHVHDVAGRAEVLIWLAQKLNALRQPKRLMRISDLWPKEDALPNEIKAKLWTEWGTALRSRGDFWRAWEWYERVARIYEGRTDTRDARNAIRNLAVGYRETGAPDRALSMLTAVHRYTIGSERLESFENIIATHLALGQPEQALATVESALELALGPFGGHRNRLLAQRAMITASTSPAEATVTELLKRPPPSADDRRLLFAEAAAWLTALYRESSSISGREDVQDRVQALADALTSVRDRAHEADDAQTEMLALSALAFLCDRFDMPDAIAMWRQIDQMQVDGGQGHNIAALLALARRAYANSDATAGRALLERVPGAVAGSVGNAEQLAGVTSTLERLVWMFERVARAVVDQAKARHEDWRLVSEIRRDTIRQAIRHRLRPPDKRADATDAHERTFRVPSDSNLRSLSPKAGSVGVLESVDIGEACSLLLTTIDAAGAVTARQVLMPQVNLGKLTARILTKLNQWTLDRAGDPFDLEEWRTFEAWALSEIPNFLDRESHLIVIEHPTHVGLPFHVAVRDHCTCSYASSWNTILSLSDSAGPGSIAEATVGVACVPTFDDGAGILEALRQSTARTADFAQREGLRFQQAVGSECDHERLRRLLQQCTLLKLLCHGYYSPKEHEVALMVAHSGQLPLKLPQAASTAQGRAHRFSWKDIAAVERAPPLVFSAACSSLRIHLVGQGERLGLFASLNERGTLSLVAPGWDIEPKIVLPIIDSLLERHVGGTNLARDLRAACRQAETERAVPRWLAWSLSIEGEWR